MKTLKKIIFISIVLGMISSLIISCKSDDKQQTGLLTLNILEGKIKTVSYTHLAYGATGCNVRIVHTSQFLFLISFNAKRNFFLF